MPVNANDLINLIGYLRLHLNKLESFCTLLRNPDATPAEITDANQKIARQLQDMDKMITTITTVAQVPAITTTYTDKDLQSMNIIPVTSTPVASSNATPTGGAAAAVTPTPDLPSTPV